LIERARFADIEEVDVTAAFLETARRWVEHSRALEPALRQVLGDQVVDEQLADRADMVTAIEEGLLRRSLLVGIAGASR
jgi:anti-sigma factor RsiW